MYVMTDTDTWAWVEWLITKRQERGWSQSDLAREAGVTRQTVNDYESRRRANPDEKILAKISTALGFPPVHLPRLAGIYPEESELDELEQARELLAYLPEWMQAEEPRIVNRLLLRLCHISTGLFIVPPPPKDVHRSHYPRLWKRSRLY